MTPTPLDALAALAAVASATLGDLPPPPRAVAPLLSLRRLPAQRVLFAQGAPTPALFAVLQGEVAVRLRGLDGEHSLLEHVRPLRLFGLSSFASGLPSRYEAAATQASVLVVIGPAAYTHLLDHWPGFARALLTELARRYDGTLHLLASARHRPAPARLALALEQLRRERGQAAGRGWCVAATQAELAELAGVTRQTANAWLQSQGVRSALRAGRRVLESDHD